MADSGRTEKPTPRRLQKAREEGRFPTSRELVGAVQFVLFVALLVGLGKDCFEGLARIMQAFLAEAFRGDVTPERLSAGIGQVILPNLTSLAVIAAALLATTVLMQVMVTGVGFATKQLAPDFTRLNPMGRLKNLPRQNVPATVQAVVMLPLFAFLVWGIIQPNLNDLLMLPLASAESGAARIIAAVESLLWKVSFVFLLFGGIDFFRQRRRYVADLRMTQQEIREEHKELEGNPQIKMRIRRLQRDLLRRSMMKEVPTATAVVVNPTHFAVAIRYSMESAGAPTVVAKGKNYLALRIKARAIEHNVPIVENPPLAQALYKTVDIGQEIPPNLYRAVAEVLAYIFRLTHGGRN